MSDEQLQEATPTAEANYGELDALKNSIEALERKNHELIGKLKKAKSVPDNVDVQALLDFKAKAEQAELESQGKYTEARQAMEQQFREAAAEKDKRISELENRVRELELIAPATAALADVVHDPGMLFKAGLLDVNKLDRDDNGQVVYKDGYERTSLSDYARRLPDYMQKAPKPQGSGAPAARSTGSEGGFDEELLRRMTTGGHNRGVNMSVVMEAYRLYPDSWQKYKAEAERRLRDR